MSNPLHHLRPVLSSPLGRLIVGTLAGVLVGVLVVGSIVLVTTIYTLTDAIRHTQLNNKSTLASTERAATAAEDSLDAIMDCTTPEGDCYRRSQDSTGDAVGGINVYAVYAAACADRPDTQTVTEIEKCILRLVKSRRQ